MDGRGVEKLTRLEALIDPVAALAAVRRYERKAHEA